MLKASLKSDELTFCNTNVCFREKFDKSTVDKLFQDTNLVHYAGECDFAVVMTGGNQVYSSDSGQINVVKGHLGTKVKILDDAQQQHYAETYRYLIDTTYKHVKQAIFVGIPPRFFSPCCSLVGHFDQDFDGLQLNEFIRDMNYYLGKHTSARHGSLGGAYFLTPDVLFSSSVWKGKTPDNKFFLQQDKVHLSNDAFAILAPGLSAIIERIEEVEFLVDTKVKGLDTDFVKWRENFLLQSTPPPVISPTASYSNDRRRDDRRGDRRDERRHHPYSRGHGSDFHGRRGDRRDRRY